MTVAPRPVALKVDSAEPSVSPTTLGTVTKQGPDDVTRLITLAVGTGVPAVGLVETICPAALELEHSAEVSTALRPAWLISVRAADS